MIADLQRRIVELRFVAGIEKAEHVPFPTGDQFWVRFDHSMDLGKLEDIVTKHGCFIVKFAGLPSKLPRGLSEMLWDGVTHVITRRVSGWVKFTASLGSEPDGIAKIVTDMHGPYEIFMATEEEGIKILYEYLGLQYSPPEPPKPVTPIKPPVLTTAKPIPAAPSSATPKPQTTAQPVQPVQALAPQAPQATPPQQPPQKKESPVQTEN